MAVGSAFKSSIALQPLTHVDALVLKNACIERGRINATDKRLMGGPLGLAGHRTMACCFLPPASRWSVIAGMSGWI